MKWARNYFFLQMQLATLLWSYFQLCQKLNLQFFDTIFQVTEFANIFQLIPITWGFNYSCNSALQLPQWHFLIIAIFLVIAMIIRLDFPIGFTRYLEIFVATVSTIDWQLSFQFFATLTFNYCSKWLQVRQILETNFETLLTIFLVTRFCNFSGKSFYKCFLQLLF